MAAGADDKAVLERLSGLEVIPCNHPESKPPADAYDSMMTIQVTQDPSNIKKFCVYRGVLCFHSGFFNRALKGSFREGGSQFYEVKDCTIKTFEIFYNWMNTGAMEDKLLNVQIIKVFVFADFYAITALKNHAVEAYFRCYLRKWTTEPASLRAVYAGTPVNSTLRKVAIDLAVDTWPHEAFGSRLATDRVPVDAILDLFQAFIRRKVPGSPGYGQSSRSLGNKRWRDNMTVCFCERYHEHVAADHHPGDAKDTTPKEVQASA